MPTWPRQGWSNGPVIHPWTWDSIGTGLAQSGIIFPATSGTITQNQAFYVPFCIFDVAWVAKRMFVLNGSTINGNIDLGIYDSQGNRLVSAGSTPHASASVLQWVDITDTTLQPGQYWMAIASDSLTATFQRAAAVRETRGMFCLQQATAFVLPNPATFAISASATITVFGVSNRTI